MKRIALVLAALTLSCHGRSKTTPPLERHSGPAIALFDLRGGAAEIPHSGGALGLASPESSFFALMQAIRTVENDKDVKGVFVRFGSLGLAHAEEVSVSLRRLRAKGLPIVCHADGYSNAGYMVAASGCTRIVVSPAGEVETVGLAAQIVYLHNLLSEQLKINIDILQVGKFKGAEEPLTRDGPSPEARASLEGYLSGARGAWRNVIAEGRGAPVLARVEDGPYGPVAAQQAGLVDAIGYADDERDALRARAAVEREYYAFGGPESSGFSLTHGLGGNAPIAVVRAIGSIQSEPSGLGGGDAIVESRLRKTIASLEKDDSVKAVVLRIDSPGGSALASDLLWHALMKLRKVKPLVVSVGEMAASGGYYLASTGNSIVADRSSLLGSIGVVGGKVSFGGALERVGVHTETFSGNPSEPNAAKRAAYASPMTPWDEPTKVRVKTSMEGVYTLFLARLAEGRNLPVSVIEPSAEGRVFSGEEAKQRQLVDELGGLEVAIERARTLAHLDARAEADVVEEDGSPLQALLGGGGTQGRSPLVQVADELALRTSLEQAAPLLPLARGEHTVLATPFTVVIR